MLDFVRKHCFTLAIGILLWQGWSRSQAAEPNSSEGVEPLPAPQRIAPEEVEMRAPGAPAAAMNDPFYLAELLAQRAAEAAARSQPQDQGTGGSGGTTGVEVSAGPGVPVLRVVLQSTLPGAPGRAWINGADVVVGDAVPGADPEQPPVLLEVGGTSVVVGWRGKRFRIDLDGTAPVEEGIR